MHHKPPQLRDLLLCYKIKGKTAILFFGFSFGLNFDDGSARVCQFSCHDVTSCPVQLGGDHMLMKLIYETKLSRVTMSH